MKFIQSVKKRIGSESSSSRDSIDAKSDDSSSLKKRVSDKKISANNSMGALSPEKRTSTKPWQDCTELRELPFIREVSSSEMPGLFLKKIQLCTKPYDFHNDPDGHMAKSKRSALIEVMEYATAHKNCFEEDGVMDEMFVMLTSNLFRVLPPATNILLQEDEDDIKMEVAWPHLQISYELLLRFVLSSKDQKFAKSYINHDFINHLLALCNSEDPREREYLKTSLHRIYGKFLGSRAFIRKAIAHLFYKVVYEVEHHNGVSEILEIMGSVINGFALPIKEEHRNLLENYLIPLHKVRNIMSFQQPLCYCMSQFIDKDQSLAKPIVLGILSHWPTTNTAKEVLFINELEEIMEALNLPEFREICVPVFERVAKCITSYHFQVAERALFLWNNDKIVSKINAEKALTYPAVLGALYHSSSKHWNVTVQQLTFNVMKLLMEYDTDFFNECSQRDKALNTQRDEDDIDRDQVWEKHKKNYYELYPHMFKRHENRPVC